jgi:hypothetical protein
MTPTGSTAAESGTTGFTEAMFDHMAAEMERAKTVDPIQRLQIIAALQAYAGWAARFAIDDLRRAVPAESWPTIAAAVGAQHSTLIRQHGAGGPVLIARPAGPSGDNGQGPIRRAATALINAAFPTQALMGSATAPLLAPVQQLADAMSTTDTPEPLLAAGARVVAEAEALRGLGQIGHAFDQEVAIWDAVAQFAEVYRRDAVLIRAVAQASTGSTGTPKA